VPTVTPPALSIEEFQQVVAAVPAGVNGWSRSTRWRAQHHQNVTARREKARPRHPAGIKQINHLRRRSASGPRAETQPYANLLDHAANGLRVYGQASAVINPGMRERPCRLGGHALAPACIPRQARCRRNGRGAPPREGPAALELIEVGPPGRSLTCWSAQDIGRVAMRLARCRIRPTHVIVWSLWRRARQAAAREARIRRRPQL